MKSEEEEKIIKIAVVVSLVINAFMIAIYHFFFNKMKASELRIGNWVTSVAPLSGSIYEAQRFDGNIFMAINETFYYWNDDLYTGIPLTEEWLLKFGFEDQKASQVYLTKEIDSQREMRYDGRIIAVQSKNSGFVWILEKIKYVHQLQNLFFSLTGEELT